MKVNNYLNIVKNYTHLPDNETVQDFLSKLVTQSGQPIEDMDSCFIVARDQTEAFLLISLCFGGINIINELCQGIAQIGEKNLQNANNKLSKFNWDGSKTTLARFENNAKEYGSQYPFYRQYIFDNISQSRAKQVFEGVKRNSLLYGVQIRVQSKTDARIAFRRPQQENEQNLRGDTTFLLIAKCRESIVVGVLHKDQKVSRTRTISIASRQSFSMKQNSENEKNSKSEDIKQEAKEVNKNIKNPQLEEQIKGKDQLKSHKSINPQDKGACVSMSKQDIPEPSQCEKQQNKQNKEQRYVQNQKKNPPLQNKKTKKKDEGTTCRCSLF